MDPKTLYRLGIFLQVTEEGSFTAAGDKLGLSKSIVSQSVTDLESQLGTRLLNRTTRSISTTEEGELVKSGARTMIDEIETVLTGLEIRRETASGVIRLTSSHNFANNYLVCCVARFCESNPAVAIDLTIEDAILNMVEERFDVAFRIGKLEDSSFHAVKICKYEMLLCASPAYLERHGPILAPRDVRNHPWVAINILPDVRRLQLSTTNDQTFNMPIEPRFSTNSGLTAKQLIAIGAGVGLLPDYAIVDDLAQGRLVRLLPEWRHRDGDISALYVNQKQMPPRVRLFLNFLKEDAKDNFPRGSRS
jgi:DNA-binding transcriptional LysR family regulator